MCDRHNKARARTAMKASNEAWKEYDMIEFGSILEVRKIEQRLRVRQLEFLTAQMDIEPTEQLRAQHQALHIEIILAVGQLRGLREAVVRRLKKLPAEPLEGNPIQIVVRARQRVQEVLRDIDARNEIFRRNMELRFMAQNNLARLTPLAAFATDRQNVHTEATNVMVRNINTQLETVAPVVDSLREIAWEWNAANLGTAQQRNSVRADMTYWYTQESVSTLNDFAYKNMLDRVWGLINSSRHKQDMIVRLWEECVDAVGMCAAGHLTRLANAVQGFEEAEAPVLEESQSERLQTAMSQISELDPSERESAARQIFAELGVEGDAQRPWLEALEV